VPAVKRGLDMSKRSILRRFAIVSVPVVVVAAGLVGMTATSAAAVSCGGTQPWRVADGGFRQNPSFLATNINIRSGPSTGCGAIATGDPWHYVRYDCYIPTWATGDGHSWSHITDYSYGPPVTGWVRDDKLADRGANVRC
jgi:hypothetical protein